MRGTWSDAVARDETQPCRRPATARLPTAGESRPIGDTGRRAANGHLFSGHQDLRCVRSATAASRDRPSRSALDDGACRRGQADPAARSRSARGGRRSHGISIATYPAARPAERDPSDRLPSEIAVSTFPWASGASPCKRVGFTQRSRHSWASRCAGPRSRPHSHNAAQASVSRTLRTTTANRPKHQRPRCHRALLHPRRARIT